MERRYLPVFDQLDIVDLESISVTWTPPKPPVNVSKKMKKSLQATQAVMNYRPAVSPLTPAPIADAVVGTVGLVLGTISDLGTRIKKEGNLCYIQTSPFPTRF
ncbi:hypothetical protein BC829DRAFT_277145 [Chytridium lagenaria]|nr:hypothetical protein BC829DRAFT_277145 [Chytridium lagenaria]